MQLKPRQVAEQAKTVCFRGLGLGFGSNAGFLMLPLTRLFFARLVVVALSRFSSVQQCIRTKREKKGSRSKYPRFNG